MRQIVLLYRLEDYATFELPSCCSSKAPAGVLHQLRAYWQRNLRGEEKEKVLWVFFIYIIVSLTERTGVVKNTSFITIKKHHWKWKTSVTYISNLFMFVSLPCTSLMTEVFVFSFRSSKRFPGAFSSFSFFHTFFFFSFFSCTGGKKKDVLP